MLITVLAVVLFVLFVIPLALAILLARVVRARGTLTVVVVGEQVDEDVDRGDMHGVRSATRTDMGETSGRRIGLVGCVKQKLATPAPAADLYTSPLFRGRRNCVERSCDEWYVLSALHGLLSPDEVIEPYDVTLSGAGVARRRAWTANVLGQIDAVIGDLNGTTVEIHAGESYCGSGLIAGLEAQGAVVDRRMVGMSMGPQLAAYADGRCDGEAPGGSGHLPTRRLPTRATPSDRVQGRHPMGPRPSGKYAPLYDYLIARTGSEVRLTFAQVQEILGSALPASARNHNAWWGTDPKHTQAPSWLNAGFRASPNLTAESVTFHPR